MSAGELLRVESVVRTFGALRALDGMDLVVNSGDVVGLVGPNGSGKTTLINVITGIYRPSSGKVILDGDSIVTLSPHRRVALGINRTFQIPRPFGDLTVRENLDVAWGNGGKRHSDVDECLEMVGLSALADTVAHDLNAAEQKLLDLARALATSPRLLLVDELGAGLNPAEFAEVADTLLQIADTGVAMVVVEHLMGFLQRVANRAVVMNLGSQLFAGSLDDALADPEVVKVFLGE